MPKFDVNLWKNLHPASTEGSGMVAALKDWHLMCPEDYEETAKKIPPAKIASAVSTAMKRFTAAISAAEGKLAKDKSTDAKEKDKIAKTKSLLAKWEKEAIGYYKEVSRWAQATVKEESEEKKHLQAAQQEFAAVLAHGLQATLQKLPPLAKEFDALLRAGRLDQAEQRFVQHRDLVQQAQWHLKPVAIASEREKVAGRHKVDSSLLPLTPQFHDLAKKLGEANTLDGTMLRRLRNARAGEEDNEDEDPAYDDALTEAMLFAKKHVNKIRPLVPEAGKWAVAARNIAGGKYPDAAAADKGISECVRVVNAMQRVLMAVESSRALLWGKNARLNAIKRDAKLKEEDFSKSVAPVLTPGADAVRKILKAKDQMASAFNEWLDGLEDMDPPSRNVPGTRKFLVEVTTRYPLETT